MAKGADIIEFYENGFPSGHYHDDSEIEIQDDDGKTFSIRPRTTLSRSSA